MARSFVQPNSRSLVVNQAAVTAHPFTLACWFRSYDLTIDSVLMWVGDKDAPYYWCALYAYGADAGDPVGAFNHSYAAGGAPNQRALTTSGFSLQTWHHACGVFVNNSERHAYIDGGSKGSDLNAAGVVSNHDRTAVGAARDSTPTNYASAAIAEAAIWDVALTDAEVAALARGINARYLRVANLKMYVPLWGFSDPEPDLSQNGINLGLSNNPPQVDHAPVTLFTRKP